MHSRNAVEVEAQRQNWYSVIKHHGSDGHTRYEYVTGKNISEAVPIAEKFMGEKKSAVDRLIKLLKPRTTDECSVIATLHATWGMLLKLAKQISDEAIIQESIRSHPEKGKISMKDWDWGLDWSRKNNMVPKGGT